MRIMGIDPGSLVTGVAVLETQSAGAGKVIHLEAIDAKAGKNRDFAPRLRVIKSALDQIIAKTQPDAVAIERIFFGKNADSAFKLGHARGVCLLAIAERDLPIHEYAARLVKKMVTGSGKSDKLGVQVILRQMFGLPPDCPWDASDALAVALTHSLALQNPLQRLHEFEGEV